MVKEDMKLLVVGIGSIGRRHSDVLYSLLGCKNITLWDPVLKNAQDHAAKYPGMRVSETYEEALNEHPDAVFICSPPALHMVQAEMALRAGAHVMVEKPLAQSTESLQPIIALAKEKNLTVSVALCNRYHKGIRRVKELVDMGTLGKIINIRATMCEFFPHSRPDYLNTYYVRYSGCFELIHAVDYAIWVAGGRPTEIYGIYGSDADIGFSSPDNAEILLRTDKGVTCSVNLGFYRFPAQSELFVYGTEGTAELRYTHTGYSLRLYTRESGEWVEETVDGLERNMMFSAEDGEFLDSIVSGKYSGCGLEDAARAVEVYEKVYGAKNPPPSV